MISEENLLKLWNHIFNISLNMLHNQADAEDAAQEIILKIVENFDSFRNESKLETWAYRIASNYLIDCKRKHIFETISFDDFQSDVSRFAEYNNELGLNETEERIYIDQIKTGCTMAMLQCLGARDRFVYIIGCIFNFDGSTAAEICGISESSYRKILSRSRRKIANFMNNNCGLVSEKAFCRCRKRLLIAHQRGRITTGASQLSVEELKIKDYLNEMNEIDAASKVFQSNPYFDKREYFAGLLAKSQGILNA